MTELIPETISFLSEYFVEKPRPLCGAETIQLILLREVLDFAIFRTEESKELNTALTQSSIEDDTPVVRVAFLGTKQKAVESRNFSSLLRTAAKNAELSIKECYLKDYLCLKCPRCGLFGGTTTSSSGNGKANIKHRIGYSTAFSLDSFDKLQESITFNGISDKTVQTGQALGSRNSIIPGSIFPSVVTLRSVTWKEFVWTVKTILSSHKYGAESRIGGDVRNSIVGIVAGWEELISPLELTLELAAVKNNGGKICPEKVQTILNSYKEYTANPNKIKILNLEELDQLLDETQKFELTREFIKESYKDIEEYRKEQGE